MEQGIRRKPQPHIPVTLGVMYPPPGDAVEEEIYHFNPRCVTIFLHTPSVTRGPFSPPPGISGSGNPVNLLFSKVIKHAFRSLHTKSQVKILRGSGDMDENVILLYCYLFHSLTIILISKHLPHMMSCGDIKQEEFINQNE